MATGPEIKASRMEMNLIWESELPYYGSQTWWYERGGIVESPRETNVLLLVKIAQVEPCGGYCVSPGEKLITAKPITKLEAPNIQGQI